MSCHTNINNYYYVQSTQNVWQQLNSHIQLIYAIDFVRTFAITLSLMLQFCKNIKFLDFPEIFFKHINFLDFLKLFFKS